MKRLMAMLTAALLPAVGAVAQDAQTTHKEWPAFIEPLMPLGDRLAEKMTGADDPQLRAELYKLIYSQISSGYLALLYADPKHPDFWPSFNEAYNIFGPNPDNSYYLTPIEGNGTYKISGYR